MLRFSAVTIGCKVNQYETQAITALLRRMGLRDANDLSKPSDLIIVNTCCVTSSASGKSRRAIRRIVRKNPNADIFILGCYATFHGQELRQLAIQTGATGQIHVFGHHDNISACLQQHLSSVCDPGREKKQCPKPTRPVRYEKSMMECISQHPAKDCPNPTLIETDRNSNVKKNYSGKNLPTIEVFTGHQRAFVKVQDGCDAFCTYCIIPHLRSRLSSRPAGEIINEVSNLITNGHKEIVLCGVFLGAYGRNTTIRRKWSGPSAMPELLRRVADMPGLWRVRLSSLEPGDVTDELLKIFRNRPTVAPHLHLPLQSGSSRILKRMNRQYNREQFFDAVRRVRESVNQAAITTDVVVGFPGETEEDFAETLAAAEQAEFSKIHTFGFSPRPGTAAWNWRKEVPHPTIVKARCAKLAELEREMSENFRRRFIGRTVEAIVEMPNTRTPLGHARGLTDRYIEVTFPKNGGEDLTGKIVRLRIERLSNGGLEGTLVKNF
ncbi:MAG: tRNA (N(6)-L-threonylcarbamoyladenosine(37)-C(2))-methylthiotransferase MtaB [Planctomycetota bacterium]|nr:tRNA (N(6)-L-threonylcarbamoyladenosine(37)-C(2))-methylthiotransferase MtaB [Planctomycetota bacterium]